MSLQVDLNDDGVIYDGIVIYFHTMLRSKDNLYQEIIDFIKNADDLIILAPYIKYVPLKNLLQHTEAQSICIVKSWKPRDIKFGASDLEVYTLCKEKNIPLFINNQIHLKAISKNNFSEFIVSSANITNRGLALSERYNYELGAILNEIDISDKIYIEKIIQSSDIANDDLYNKYLEAAKNIVINEDMPEYFDIKQPQSDKDFLLNSLPMSFSIDDIKNYYFNGAIENLDEVQIRSAIHDLFLYDIRKGLSEKEFPNVFKNSFTNHPFIIKFLEFNGNGNFFGKNKAWIQNECTTVPTPRRSEITPILQSLYKLITELLPNEYYIDVPNHSQRLMKK